MARKRRGLGVLIKIPKSAYSKARKKVARQDAYWNKHATYGRGGWSSMNKERTAKMAKRFGSEKRRNRDRSVVEVYEFQNRKAAAPFVGYLKGNKITNWTGLRLCTVTKRGGGRSGFPDVTGRRAQRVTVTAKCIDGRQYVGASPGDGMYARMRPKKGGR